MIVKVINPNTSVSMTEKVGAAARAAAAPCTRVVVVQPPAGLASIEGHYDEAMSVPGLLAEVRRGEAEGCAGYVIACFGDPGRLAARELARGPVVGIAEAAMLAASLVAEEFGIVTTLARTRGIAQALVAEYGMARRCRSIRATDRPVLALEQGDGAAQQAVREECWRAVREDGVDAVVLGCAGMADLAVDLTEELGRPVIEGVGPAVRLVEMLVGLGFRTSKTGSLAYPLPKPYRGNLQAFTWDP